MKAWSYKSTRTGFIIESTIRRNKGHCHVALKSAIAKRIDRTIDEREMKLVRVEVKEVQD